MSAAVLEGALPVLKPPGMTSHDVVDAVRRQFGLRRVGHTGTLDPLAAGVLVLLLGRATRASRYFLDLDKAYRAEALFGVRTSSGDLDGRVVERRPTDHLQPRQVATAAGALTGAVTQRPPAASAVRVGGERLYRRARRGENVEAPLRTVHVRRFALVAWRPDDRPGPRAVFDIECSSGTYVRSLVDDLGRRLDTAATTWFLLRTRVGPFTLVQAHTLEELARPEAPGQAIPLAEALSFLPAVHVDAEAARSVRHGRPLPAASVRGAGAAPGRPLRVLDAEGRLLAVARVDVARDRLAYDVVFAAGGAP